MRRKNVALWLETMIKDDKMRMMKEVNILKDSFIDELVVRGVVKGELVTHPCTWARWVATIVPLKPSDEGLISKASACL